MTALTATREELERRLEANHLRAALQECPIPSPWLNETEAAAYLRCSRGSLANKRLKGNGPKYANFGIVLYHFAWLDEYAHAHSRRSTSDKPKACGYGCHGGERTVPLTGDTKPEGADA